MDLAHLADRLTATFRRYPPESKECVVCAREVRRLLRSQGIEAEVVRVTHALLGQYSHTQEGVCFAETGFHVTVRMGDLLIDALTGPEGKLRQDYYTLWRDIEPNELILAHLRLGKTVSVLLPPSRMRRLQRQPSPDESPDSSGLSLRWDRRRMRLGGKRR
jgi:hypothetical protein